MLVATRSNAFSSGFRVKVRIKVSFRAKFGIRVRFMCVTGRSRKGVIQQTKNWIEGEERRYQISTHRDGC